MTDPKLSIMVCTRNRAAALLTCLDAIDVALQNASPVSAEIVVIDNASTDDTSVMVGDWAKEHPHIPVQLLYENRRGVSVGRNTGIRSARGELLVFTDDDCRLNGDYIVNLLRLDATDAEPVLRGGRIELGTPSDLPLTIKTSRRPRQWHKRMNSARRENLGNCLLSCNMAARRSVIDRVGFFDEQIGAGARIPAGEDTDYVFRAYLNDILIAYSPEIAVHHYHGRKDPADGYALMRNYSLGGGALYAKYFWRNPNFCRQFFWDIRNALKEITDGNNRFLPEIDFSHRDKVLYCAMGIFKYLTRPSAITP
jgi:glycosyltransferase involved in cell wall biosynthesis